MKRARTITALFVDIGGVLLTNGWDHVAGGLAATHFKLESAEMEERHHLTFDTYEGGKLTLEEYLERVIFYRKRPFTKEQFRRFMFAQSKPYPEMLALTKQIKTEHGLKVSAVSNEAQENTPMFVRIAEGLGIRSILHTEYDSTREKLAAFGLAVEGEVLDEAG